MRLQRKENCVSIKAIANEVIPPLDFSRISSLLLLFISSAEGLIHTNCRIGVETSCIHHRRFCGTSTTTSDVYNVRNLWTSLRQNANVMSATDVASLDSDGDLKMSENTEREPWWRSYRFDDEELSAETRPDFPILNKPLMGDIGDDATDKPLIYLDSAATSQKPTFVTDKITFYYHNVNSNVHRGAHTLSRQSTNMYEAARDQVAKFINAYSRNEVIFTSGATEAINLVAYTWGKTNLRSGDEIILTVAEHHSNIVPWQIISEQTGAILKFVPLITSDDGDLLDWEGSFHNLLSEKTKVVSFQHASNVLGNINPVHQIVKMTKSRASPDCIILLDACQSVPHQPVDVQALGVDFLAASGHKMCAPTGIGFLWGREHLLNKMPPFKGGGEMIHEVFLTHSTYASAPGRFEAGTPVSGFFKYFFNYGRSKFINNCIVLKKLYQRYPYL
jgi:SufS family cysteine desulfurase